jgi:hypothetical protein
MAALAGNFMDRLKKILEIESVEYNEKDAADIILKYAPDWRRILNEAQRHGNSGILTTNSRLDGSGNQYDVLMTYLKGKDFKKMRSWVVNNIDVDASAIFRGIYDNMANTVSPQSIPQLVLILADYQYKNAFVADHELNVVACMTEVMANVEFA